MGYRVNPYVESVTMPSHCEQLRVRLLARALDEIVDDRVDRLLVLSREGEVGQRTRGALLVP